MTGGGSGIDRYITELSQEILKQDQAHEFVLFFKDAQQAEKYKSLGKKSVITGVSHYSLAEQWKLPGILRKEKLDLVHFPHFNVPILYNRPFVVTIHDLTHTIFPGRKKSHFFHRLAYHMVFNAAVMKSKKIIAVSQSTKSQILDHFGVNPDKITVVYEGFNETYKMIDKDAAFAQVSNRFAINKPYILYVGVWRRYKNLPLLAKAFDKLVDKGQNLELVLVGSKDPYYPEIEQQVFSIKNKERLKAVGRVSDEELNLLQNGAKLFVLPSLMEGFGLTALEAAATGTPIACSDIPTLREILGQGAEYFDPNNLENMIDVLNNLLNNDKRLEELANLALSRSKHFSWKDAAQKTLEVYTK